MASRILCKDLMPLVKAAEREHGWSVTTSGGNHLRWQGPEKGQLVFTASTPSDARRAAKNIVRDLRSVGLDLQYVLNGHRKAKAA